MDVPRPRDRAGAKGAGQVTTAVQGRALVIVFGPPAVGKMAVGLELQRLTGLRLFHNHMSVDLALRFFAFGTPPFGRLVRDVRRRVFEEVAASDLPGLVFTFVWSLGDSRDRAFIDELTPIFSQRGAQVCFAELEATQTERLRRNETPLRLAEKAPKRNLVESRAHLIDLDRQHRLNTSGDFFYPDRHLKIENSALEPTAVAERIIDRFRLPRVPTGDR